jgi:hypothetical protein
MVDRVKKIADEQKTASKIAVPRTQHLTPRTLETGGPKGPEPTRYGDWEIAGKCVDF